MEIFRESRNQLLYVLFPKLRSFFSTPVALFIRTRQEEFSSVAILGRTFFGNYEGFEETMRRVREVTYAPEVTVEGRQLSDAGWGCVVRAGQMLLLNILTVRLRLDFGPLLPLFAGSGENSTLGFGSFFSEATKKFKLREGDFWNFKQFFLCVERLWAASRVEGGGLPGLRVVLHDDAQLSREAVEGFLAEGRVLLVFNFIIRDPGTRSRALRRFFSVRQFAGCLGAVATRCFYFFGAEGDRGLLLDPHVLRDQRGPEDFEVRSVESMSFARMDDCLSLAFLVETLPDLDQVLSALRRQPGAEVVPIWTLPHLESDLEGPPTPLGSQEFLSSPDLSREELAQLD